MKKFLDLSHKRFITASAPDSSFIPVAALDKQEQICKKILEKINLGFKSTAFPFVYFFESVETCELSLYFNLLFSSAVKSGKNQFLFPAHSKKSVLEFAKNIKKMQMQVQLISPDAQGRCSLAHLHEKLGPKSLVFSQRWVHPVLGVVDDQSLQIADLLSQHNVLYHMDITGALGEKFFDLETLSADFITFDLASLERTLKGGVLFSKTPLNELMPAALEPTSLFLEKILNGFENFYENASHGMLKKISLKMQLMQSLKEKIPQCQSVVIPTMQSIAQIVVHFPKVHQEALSFLLLSKRISVDLGGGNELTLSSLLEMLEYDAHFSKSCIGFSLYDDLESEDIDELVEQLLSAYTLLLKGAL